MGTILYARIQSVISFPGVESQHQNQPISARRNRLTAALVHFNLGICSVGFFSALGLIGLQIPTVITSPTSNQLPTYLPIYHQTNKRTLNEKSNKMSQSFTPADVASHNSPDKGLFIIVDQNVYDVTNFVDEHPGGAKILKRVAGKDASKQFWKVGFVCPFPYT